MGTVRDYRADLAYVLPQPKVRDYRTSLTGTVAATPKVRDYRADLTGVAAVRLNPLTAQEVEPETTVTLTTTMVDGSTPDSWTWRRISGPVIGLEGTGGTRTFTAPSTAENRVPVTAVIVVGVAATKGGVTSPEQTVTVTVLPQTRWVWNGTAWVGARALVFLGA